MPTHFERGIALLNQGDFYEAHEALEDAWREASGAEKLFRQSLVQVAVAFHHQSTGNLAGARSVLSRAIRNLGPYEQGFSGLDLLHLLTQLRSWSDALEGRAPSQQPISVRFLSDPS